MARLLGLGVCAGLLGLNEADAARCVPLVHDGDFVGGRVAEDIEIVVHVVECEDGLLDGDGLGQVEALDLGGGGGSVRVS